MDTNFGPLKKRSSAWNFFVLKDPVSAACNLCGAIMKYHGSTSSMTEHLKRKHKNWQDIDVTTYNFDLPIIETKDAVQSIKMDNEQKPSSSKRPRKSVTESKKIISNENHNNKTSEKKTEYDDVNTLVNNVSHIPSTSMTRKVLKSCEIDRIDRSLVLMIVDDLQPVTIVQEEGFRQLVHALNPLYEIPSPSVITEKLLPNLYQEKLLKMQSSLNEAKYVSIGVDLWANERDHEFISLTAYYILGNQFMNSVLATEKLPLNATTDHLAYLMTNVLDKWLLNDKICVIITNGEQNIKAAVVDYMHLEHMLCLGQNINICVAETINASPVVLTLLKKCRVLIYTLQSEADKLKEIQLQLSLPDLNLTEDDPTRWNTIFQMLKSILDGQHLLTSAENCFHNSSYFLNDLEWTILSEVVSLLAPINEITEELCRRSNLTLSFAIPLIKGLTFSLRNKTQSTEAGQKFHSSLIENINWRLGGIEMNAMAAKATFLDPRFKRVGFIHKENSNNAEKFVQEELEQLMQQSNPHSSANHLFSENNQNRSIWDSLDSEIDTYNNVVVNSGNITRHYLELPYVERTSENPLPSCEQMSISLPEMLRLQHKYLAIPATCVPAKQIYTDQGLLRKQRRNQIVNGTHNHILFLNGNKML